MLLLKNNQKIGFFDHLYYTKIKKYQVVYNPYSYKKPVVLEKNVFDWFKKFLKGQYTINEIVSNNIFFGKNKLLTLMNYLFRHDLLSINGLKNQMFVNPRSNPEKASFWIDVTNQCNFRCTYCYVDRKKEIIDSNKFKDLFDKLMNQKKDYPFKEIVLILAGGEPLLYFDTLKKLIKAIQQIQNKYKEIKIETLIISNGSLLTKEKAVYLKENRIKMAISLDGIEEYNDKTRQLINGNGTYRYILKGINIAKQHKIFNNVITTITSKNINHLPELVTFFLEKEINFQFQFYKKTTQYCLDEPINFDKRAIQSYYKAIEIIYDYYRLKPNLKRLSIFLESSKALFYTSEYGCAAGYNYFTITPNCEIKVCPSSNIKVPFEKVPNFISFLRKKHSSFIKYSTNTNPICKKCLWKYACKGGCKMEQFVTKRTKQRPNVCTFYKKILPYLIKLEAKSLIESDK